MNLNLLSCDAKRPDRRAIANCFEQVGIEVDGSTAREMTEILLDGDTINIEVDDKNSSSAFRALRKLDIDYEIED